MSQTKVKDMTQGESGMNRNEIKIDIDYGVHNDTVYANKGTSIYQILCENGVFIDAICGGNGTCGKCKIKLIQGELDITNKDSMYFSNEDLKEGYRLACMAYPKADCYIKIDEKKQYQGIDLGNNVLEYQNKITGEYGIAIDIGTTTIVYQLTDTKTGHVINQMTEINNNRMYGADVLSRIDAANKGMLPVMCMQLREQLRNGINKLYSKLSTGDDSYKMVIAGNTTMIHILMGYSCEQLGKYPFKPVTTNWIYEDTTSLKLSQMKNPVTILPGLSAFIGGDIIAGLSLVDFGMPGRKEFFLDLGTNGEMVVSDGNGNIFTASASAGPAFEGGNITCGTGSISGAIESCKIENNSVEIKTINNQRPVGICGSGIIEILYELRKNHIVDDTGLLMDEYFEKGYPIYTDNETNINLNQKDIREIQMAKAAIAAGMEILLKHACLEISKFDTIYLAGNFGYHLNLNKAIGIGLLNNAWKTKIKLLGNTSLKGANNYLCGWIDENKVTSIINRAREIYFSNDSDFSDKYMHKMYLENISEFD